MKRIISICAAFALVLCLLPVSALAYFNNYPIDVDALKALEQTDEFDVRITKKTITDGASSDFNNPDILTLTIENGSDKALTQVVVLLVCHDADNISMKFQNEGGIYVGSVKSKRVLNTFTFEDLNVAPGAVFQQNIPCTHGNFTGARALVAQYTDSEGDAVTNPLYADWQELALGSPTHILD